MRERLFFTPYKLLWKEKEVTAAYFLHWKKTPAKQEPISHWKYIFLENSPDLDEGLWGWEKLHDVYDG